VNWPTGSKRSDGGDETRITGPLNLSTVDISNLRRIAGILLIMLGCGVLSWSVSYDGGLSWGATQTSAIITGTITSGIALLVGGRRSILTCVWIAVTVSILAIAPRAARVGELFDFTAFTDRTSLTTAWLLIVCYVPVLAFLLWRAWQLPKS